MSNVMQITSFVIVGPDRPVSAGSGTGGPERRIPEEATGKLRRGCSAGKGQRRPSGFFVLVASPMVTNVPYVTAVPRRARRYLR